MIGAIIYAALAADTGVAALVGTRIYPEQAPDGADLPLIVYTVRLGEGPDGTAPILPVTVTANGYAASDAGAESLGDAVFARLEGFNGADAGYFVRALALSEYSEVRDAEVNLWGRLQTFTGTVLRR